MPLNNPSVGKKVVSGTYTGTDVDDRQITCGFVPTLVILISDTGSEVWIATRDQTVRFAAGGGTTIPATDLLMHGSDGFVVDELNANSTTRDPYNYWAIS